MGQVVRVRGMLKFRPIGDAEIRNKVVSPTSGATLRGGKPGYVIINELDTIIRTPAETGVCIPLNCG